MNKIGRKGKDSNFYKDGKSSTPKFCRCGKKIWYQAEMCRECYENNSILPGKSHSKEYNTLYKKMLLEKNPNYKNNQKICNKKWRENNKKYIKEYNKKWRSENKEKIYFNNIQRKLKLKNIPGSFTHEQWIALKQKHNNKCVICGVSENNLKENKYFKKLTKDHIISISNNGTNDIENIQPLCVSCNSKKRNQIVVETIFTSGVFDLFHIGHVLFLMQAKSMCKKLIVGVSIDKLVESYKGSLPIYSYEDRFLIIDSLCCVDKTVKQSILVDIKQFKKLKADKFALGDDWKDNYSNLGINWLRDNNKIIWIPYTTKISTTKIKEKIIENANIIQENLKKRKNNV